MWLFAKCGIVLSRTATITYNFLLQLQLFSPTLNFGDRPSETPIFKGFRLSPPVTPPPQDTHLEPSIQESEKPKRYLVADADFYAIICDKTVWDVLNLAETLAASSNLEQPAVVHHEVSPLWIGQHMLI